MTFSENTEFYEYCFSEWNSIKCLFPFSTCFINITFQIFLGKITPSWKHNSALSQDILNSCSSIVIWVINCHRCCSDGRLQTEQISKGVFCTVFISLKRKGCFVRKCKFLRGGTKKSAIQRAFHLFFRAKFQWLLFFHTIGNYTVMFLYQIHFFQSYSHIRNRQRASNVPVPHWALSPERGNWVPYTTCNECRALIFRENCLAWKVWWGHCL